MSGLTASEYGAIGNAVLRRKYPKNVLRAWARRGGRKPIRTNEQIKAGIYPQPQRRRPVRTAVPAPETVRQITGEVTPITLATNDTGAGETAAWRSGPISPESKARIWQRIEDGMNDEKAGASETPATRQT